MRSKLSVAIGVVAGAAALSLAYHFWSGEGSGVKTPTQAEQKISHIELSDGSARSTVPGMTTSAAYFTLHNNDKQPVMLTGVESPVAKKSELHTTVMENNTMRMQEVESLEVPAGETLTFKPGGYHVMLMGLENPINPGDKVPVTLSFNNGEKVTIDVEAMKEVKGQHMAH